MKVDDRIINLNKLLSLLFIILLSNKTNHEIFV